MGFTVGAEKGKPGWEEAKRWKGRRRRAFNEVQTLVEADGAARLLVCVGFWAGFVTSELRLGWVLTRPKWAMEADWADGFLLRTKSLSQALGQMSARCCRGRVAFKETIKRNYRNI